MANKTDIGRKTNAGSDKNAADRRHRPLKTSLDRIDELQDFYDFSPVTYLSLDAKGRVLSINLTGAVMMKVVRSELIGQSLYSHVVREDRDILYLHLRRLFKNKKPQSSQLRLQTAASEKIHVAQIGRAHV